MSQEEKTVVLQTDVRELLRTRLKLQAVRLGTTMSLLAQDILDEGLKNTELNADRVEWRWLRPPQASQIDRIWQYLREQRGNG